MSLIDSFAFGASTAPLSWVICGEIGSVKLRNKASSASGVSLSDLSLQTISIGLSVFNAIGIVSGIVTPYLLNPKAANLKGKAAWITVGLDTLIILWAWRYLPETQGRSAEDLDILFENRVASRKFASYVISTEEQFGIIDDKTVAAREVQNEPEDHELPTIH